MEMAMNDALTMAAGAMAILTAGVHQVLGEIRLFSPMNPAVVPQKPILRLVWVNGSLAWAGLGVLLFMAPTFGSQPARHWILTIFVLVLGSAAIWAFLLKRNHPGWMLLSTAVGLALAGG
jgi:hypothetical protein